MGEVTHRYELPYPPSVNHYWRHVGRRTLISRGGRKYRQAVEMALLAARATPLHGRLELRMLVYPPDRRTRDLDNLTKATIDSMQRAGLYDDDSQIDRIEIIRAGIVPGGKVVVELTEQR